MSVIERIAALALVLAMALIPLEARADDCQGVGSRCGSMVKRGCLARLGLAPDPAAQDAPRTCAGQLDDYRGCLARAANDCSPAGDSGTTLLTSLTDELCAVGVWRGPIVEPGFEIYSVQLEIGMRNGAPFARARYPELNCASRGDVIEGPKERRIVFREVVTKNRERCADGRYEVTCMVDGRLHWRWHRDNGEFFDAILTR